MPTLKERLEGSSEREINFLRKLFVAIVLVLIFWGAWKLVVSLVG